MATCFFSAVWIICLGINIYKYIYIKKNKNLADKHLSITYLQVNLNYTGVHLDAV